MQPADHPPVRQWEIFTKRPYLAVMILVFIAFLVMLKVWMWLFLVGITVGVGIFVIGHNHHPNRHLKLGFHLPAAGFPVYSPLLWVALGRTAWLSLLLVA